MSEDLKKTKLLNEQVYSKKLRAGKRSYFFDVKETRAKDYYLTITESKKKVSDQGVVSYEKHKIYLYKEDFMKFKDIFSEVTDYIIEEKGEEIISDKKNDKTTNKKIMPKKEYTNISFEDLK